MTADGSKVRCPWCSAEIPQDSTGECPACGASLHESDEALVPGLTHVDPDVAARIRPPQQRHSRGLLGFLAGDVEPAEPAEPAPPAGSLEPPSTAVRAEMRRLELAALEAEMAARRAELVAAAAEAGIQLPDLVPETGAAAAAAGETPAKADTGPGEGHPGDADPA